MSDKLAEEQRAHARTAQECREAREAADHWFTEANRDHNDLVRATETLAGIERLLKDDHGIEYDGAGWWNVWSEGGCISHETTLADAIQAALAELDKETK